MLHFKQGLIPPPGSVMQMITSDIRTLCHITRRSEML